MYGHCTAHLLATSMFLFCLSLSAFYAMANGKLDNVNVNCATFPVSIHINKEELDSAGNVVRNCEGNFTVNKCEGTCISSLQPSVNHPTGFLKKCTCCRETRMRSKKVHLNQCYDQDGKRLIYDRGMMTIVMKEPEECDCFKCGY